MLFIYLICGFIIIGVLPNRFNNNFNVVILLYATILLFVVCWWIFGVIRYEYFLNLVYYGRFSIFTYDSVSLLFIFLTSILYIISILVVWHIEQNKKLLYMLIHSVICFTIFSFSTFNLLFFFIFFEIILIPMFLIIGIWGSRERRLVAAFRFFLYTAFGSIFFLIVVIYLLYNYHTANVYELYLYVHFSKKIQCVFWFLCFITFMIKTPLVPLHTWLPEAHAEAPTVGSILLAGILLKLGPYGLIRFSNFLFPYGFFFFRPLIFFLCLLSICYTALTALRQLDIKKVIAYSSIGHMALVIIGLCINSLESYVGAILLLIGHGFVSAGLFLLVGFIYDRYRTRNILYYNGLVRINPLLAFLFFFFLLGNISFPGTMNFKSELFIVVGLFKCNWYVTIFVLLSSIIVLAYNLFLFSRLFFYTEKIDYVYYTYDLDTREFISVFILLFPVYFFGICFDKLVMFIFKVCLVYIFVAVYSM